MVHRNVQCILIREITGSLFIKTKSCRSALWNFSNFFSNFNVKHVIKLRTLKLNYTPLQLAEMNMVISILTTIYTGIKEDAEESKIFTVVDYQNLNQYLIFKPRSSTPDSINVNIHNLDKYLYIKPKNLNSNSHKLGQGDSTDHEHANREDNGRSYSADNDVNAIEDNSINNPNNLPALSNLKETTDAGTLIRIVQPSVWIRGWIWS